MDDDDRDLDELDDDERQYVDGWNDGWAAAVELAASNPEHGLGRYDLQRAQTGVADEADGGSRLVGDSSGGM